MNALVITLWAEPPLTLPIDYNSTVQGALYACWREKFPALHDQGFSSGHKTFRMFTFSPLLGASVIKEDRISFLGAITLEVRSISSELVDALAGHLILHRVLRLGKRDLPVVDLRSADRLIFQPSTTIHAVAPITVHRTIDRRTVYYSPFDKMFSTLLCDNLKSKLRAAGRDDDVTLVCRPVNGTIREISAQFRETKIVGYSGDFLVAADSSSTEFLYYTGIGDRNSQGFGMFEILNEPSNYGNRH